MLTFNLLTFFSFLFELQKLFNDILSVLAMTMAAAGTRECLQFKIAGNITDVGSWGHEYIR
jgi:26S proteasome regulatory subunit N1